MKKKVIEILDDIPVDNFPPGTAHPCVLRVLDERLRKLVTIRGLCQGNTSPLAEKVLAIIGDQL